MLSRSQTGSFAGRLSNISNINAHKLQLQEGQVIRVLSVRMVGGHKTFICEEEQTIRVIAHSYLGLSLPQIQWRQAMLGPTVNSSLGERTPNFSRDGHWMFFVSNRPGGFGGDDLWASWRTHTHDDFGWQPPVNLGPGVNAASFDAGASFFENEEAGMPLLFFGSIRPGGFGGPDIYVSAQAADGSFGPAIRFDGTTGSKHLQLPDSIGWARTSVSPR